MRILIEKSLVVFDYDKEVCPYAYKVLIQFNGTELWKGSRIDSVWTILSSGNYLRDNNGDSMAIYQIRNERGLHCTDGPAMTDEEGNSQRWYIDGLLHREDGPAIVYNNAPEDNLWLWRGVGLNFAGPEIAKKIVLAPSTLAIPEIEGIENAECRRVALERFGMARYIEETNAKCIDDQVNHVEGTHEALFETPSGKFMYCICRSTGRDYQIPVPLSTKNCEEARAYMASGLMLNRCVGAS